MSVLNRRQFGRMLIQKWFTFFAISMFLLAMVGGWRSYSPIPLQDTWDGSFTFYYRMLEEGPQYFFLKHNEHRIIISRILFALDHYLFNGANWPLRIINYVLAACNVMIFWRLLSQISVEEKEDYFKFLGYFISGIFFSWVQEDNFIWEFQSQFFLAQLIPLCALYSLSRSVNHEKSSHYFAACIALVIISFGTMANGVMAAPLVIFYAMALGMSKRRIFILSLIAAILTILYFRGSSSNSRHIWIFDSIQNNPEEYVKFVLLYLGNPAQVLFHQIYITYAIGFLCLIFILCSLRVFLIEKKELSRLILIVFLQYVLLTASVTAVGRLHFGLYSALTSRYTTPALMAWASIGILIFSGRPKNYLVRIFALLGMAVFSLAFLRYQLSVFSPLYPIYAYEQKIAGLSLELGVKDNAMVRTIYPNESIYGFVSQIYSNHPGFFRDKTYYDRRKSLGEKVDLRNSLKLCVGQIDALESTSDINFQRIRGSLLNEMGEPVSEVRVLDTNFRTIGYALLGEIRPDLAILNISQYGFMGYVQKLNPKESVILNDALGTCFVRLDAPPSIFGDRELLPNLSDIKTSQKNIIDAEQWRGSDAERSSFPGIKIYGSYLRSAEDVGSLVLQAKAGDSFYYKSGPVSGNQRFEIIGTSMQGLMPYSPRWSGWHKIEFSGQTLPSGEFLMKMKDEGKAYGEWSAIAVRQ